MALLLAGSSATSTLLAQATDPLSRQDILALLSEARSQATAGDTDDALEVLADAAVGADELEDFELIARVQGQIGDVQRSVENHAEAAEAYLLAAESWQAVDDSRSALTSFARAAASFGADQATDDAFAVYDRAIEVALGADDDSTAASMVQLQGDLMVDAEEYGVAEERYLRALDLFAESDLPDRAESLQKLGSVYEQLDDQPKAIETYLMAADLWGQLDALQFEYQANLDAARLQEDGDEHAAARSIYEDMLETVDSEENPDAAADLWAAIGRTNRARE